MYYVDETTTPIQETTVVTTTTNPPITTTSSQSITSTSSGHSVTETTTPSQSETPTSSSQSVTETPSPSQSLTETTSPSQPETSTTSPSQSVTETPTPNQSVTETPSPSQLVTESTSPSQSVTGTMSNAQSVSHSASDETSSGTFSSGITSGQSTFLAVISTTPPSNVNPPTCPCRCSVYAPLAQYQNMTTAELEEALKEEILQLKRALTVPKENLSATIRKKTSARDSRPSAKSVGALGITLLSLTFSIFILFDCLSFGGQITNTHYEYGKWNSDQMCGTCTFEGKCSSRVFQLRGNGGIQNRYTLGVRFFDMSGTFRSCPSPM
ncbi:hypothetical protein KUTeg_011863 [Tegillarca granosa]|uniref:Uncharacterized protein n=1 Tax=Tegillarca granosa TaxID=220873 RepID=A0ABQ9EXW2_TEGGR|nr:hypothetical protein KUTeg_011863 [Tegillarca granosa]